MTIEHFWEINDPPDESLGHYIQEYPEDMPEEDWEGWEDYIKGKKRKRRIWNIIAIVMSPFLLFCFALVSYEFFKMVLFLYEILTWAF